MTGETKYEVRLHPGSLPKSQKCFLSEGERPTDKLSKEGLSENNHNPLPFGTYFLEAPNLVAEGCILRLEGGQLLAVRLGSSIL